MPPMTAATYHGAKALLERDFEDDPNALARALLVLDQKRSASFVASGLCSNCGRPLLTSPRQVMYCSPQCANEEDLRDALSRAMAAEDTKARWAADTAAAAASKGD